MIIILTTECWASACDQVLLMMIRRCNTVCLFNNLSYAHGNLSFMSLSFSLDTFSYAGTTTTCEYLYMGVPCVTMVGSHAYNVGVSLLSKVGKNLKYFSMN